MKSCPIPIRSSAAFGRPLAWILLGAMAGCAGARRPLIEEVAQYDTAGWAHDVIPDGRLVYVADRQAGYLVFDRDAGWHAPRVSAPVRDVISLAPHSGSPVLAARFEGLVLVSPDGAVDGRIAVGDIANAVVTRGPLAYAAYGAHGLVIARIGAHELSLLAELPARGWSHDVKLWGRYALLADWNCGTRIIDVDRPDHPAERDVLPTAATAICVALDERPGGTIAAVAEGHAGVSLAALDAGGRFSLLARHGLGLDQHGAPHPETGGWAHGVALCANHLFVANWKRGLAVLNVEDPRRPRLIEEVSTRGTSLGVKAEASPDGSVLVYLADGEAGLRVFRFHPR
jgi:hypothetical protein